MLSILVIINIPLFILDLQLVCLHTYLSYRSLTTYEYITRRVIEPVSVFLSPIDWSLKIDEILIL